MELERILDRVAKKSQETFAAKQAVLSFGEYLEALLRRPYTLTRNSAQLLRDVMVDGGTYEVSGHRGPIRRFRLFDPVDGSDDGGVRGHEEVQNRLFEILSGFVERGRADRFILLHGPSGSAKSSIVDALRRGLERYSRTESGPLYRFSWIFCEGADKGGLGFAPERNTDSLPSLAEVDDRQISSRLPCEMKDPPFFLLPKRRRLETPGEAIEKADATERERFLWTDFLVKGELSPKNKTIYESLLRSYRGDWRRVIRHVRIERYYLSHRYRVGCVTIEPQGTIDAGARLIGHNQMTGLPTVLLHEDLVEAHGDLVDGNGGLVEYSDFLKRSLEANKYLLTTAERGAVNLPGLTISLNLVLAGTTEEKYLSAFKRDPSFASFRGRFELVRVPYLREWPKEAQIYDHQVRRMARGKHLAPHFLDLAGLFSVLTRLRRPDPAHYDPALGRLLRKLEPVEKAALYAYGQAPSHWSEDDRALLLRHRRELTEEYDAQEEQIDGFADAGFEGRRGASPRELLSLLTDLAIRPGPTCLGPLDLIEALKKIIADPTLFDWLRAPKEGPYRDPAGTLEALRELYLSRSWNEIRKASGQVDPAEYQRLFAEYLRHVKAASTGEKVRHEVTQQLRDPDQHLMGEVETHLAVSGSVQEFRSSVMTRVAAFRLSNPSAPLELPRIFPDLFSAMERSFWKARRESIELMIEDALALHAGTAGKLPADRKTKASSLVQQLEKESGYCAQCATVALSYVRQHEADLED